MTSPLTSEAATTKDRAPNGRFATNNPGGLGNPFARQTAGLRTYLVNHVTERDIQEILDVLLLNAKGGHLPSIKFLFSYVIGKPKPVVEPDLLDLQEMQMLQQSAVPPETLDTLCGQLPLDMQVQLTHFTQAENAAAAVQTALDRPPAAATAPPTPAPSAPSPNGDNGASRTLAVVGGPSTDGDNGDSGVARHQEAPSTNGEMQRPPGLPRRTEFEWLAELRRTLGGCVST